MAEYVFSKGKWRGHSINDTIPSPIGKYLARRQDTNTGIVYYSDGFTWVNSASSGTVTMKETIAYAFQGTTVRVSSMIMGTNHSTASQGTSGHVLGVPLIVKRIRIFPVANAKTGNTVIKLWKDSTELATWTISAGSTTEIDSGAISHAITATEKIDITCDTLLGGAALSITIGFLVDIEKTVNLT